MKTTWRQEILPLAVLAAMFAGAAWSWPRVPDRLPIHWNAAGEVDGYGGKFVGLMLLPLVAVGMYALFLVLPKFDPGKRNYESFGKAYLALRTALILFFAVLYAATLVEFHGTRVPMTAVIMPALGMLFLIIGNVLSKIRPNHFVGIRTPWTLSSKQSWDKTHRLGGWLFVIQGVMFIAMAFASPALMLPAILGTTLAMVCILLPYSYHVYTRDPDRISPAGVTPASHEPSIASDRPAADQ
jgi:uncharacterized membrane protein